MILCDAVEESETHETMGESFRHVNRPNNMRPCQKGCFRLTEENERTSAQDQYLHLISPSLYPILERERAPQRRHRDISRRARCNGSGAGELCRG